MQVLIQDNDQAIAAVPHLLGFEPQESLVVIPVAGRGPVARIDLPRTPDDAREVIESVTGTYASDRWGSTAALLICFAEQPEATDVFSARLQEAMERQGVRVVRRLAAGDGVWHDFTAGTNGSRTAEAKSLIDAEAAFAGRRTPVQSRAALAAEFVGDTDLIAEVLDAARSQRDSSTRPLERAYCHAVVDQSRSTEHRLDLGDAARLLANLEFDLGLFLDLAREIRTTNAPEWLPLWRDLTKHAPAEVRVEPACLAAIAAWCAGDGASAWSALDRIPSDVELGHPVAPVVALLRESLHSAAHPRTWDRLCAEAFDSTSHVANPTEDATHLESTGLSPGTVPKAAGPAR